VAVRNVVASAPQPEPASRLKSTTCDVSFLRSDWKCPRNVSVLSNVTARYKGLEQKDRLAGLPVSISMHGCWIVSLCILSEDGWLASRRRRC